jgi:membrane-associated phospholipid phosphatase
LFIVARSSLPEREFLMAVTLSFVISGFLMLVINLYWKISLHVSTLAGFFSILWYYLSRVNPDALAASTTAGGAPMLKLAVFGVAVTALVMWARVEARAHTPAQVLGGAAFGLIAPYVTLSILGALGL